MRDIKDAIILNLLEGIGFKADYRTADAAINIIIYLDSLRHICEAASKEPRAKNPTEAIFYDGKWWALIKRRELNNICPHISQNTLRRLLKWLDNENVVNMHKFDVKSQNGNIGYALNEQIIRFL